MIYKQIKANEPGRFAGNKANSFKGRFMNIPNILRPLSEEAFDWEEIKDRIVEMVDSVDWVIYPEIQDLLEALGVESRGDWQHGHLDRNIILWDNLSETALGIIDELIYEDERLFLHPMDVSAYIAKGETLHFPVANIPPKSPAGYMLPHWLPACLRTIPLSD